MHKLQVPNPIWQPMVESSFIFPATMHIDLARITAENLTQTVLITCARNIDQESLTHGLKLLATHNYSELMVSVATSHIVPSSHYSPLRKRFGPEEPMEFIAGKLLLYIIRQLLFGEGLPRYGQSPQLGGYCFRM